MKGDNICQKKNCILSAAAESHTMMMPVRIWKTAKTALSVVEN